MKLIGFIVIGMAMALASPLRADAPATPGNEYVQESTRLKRHERKLERMQVDRSVDNDHTRQAQEEFRKGTAEVSGNAELQARDVQDLKSVENQVAAGRKQKTLAHLSYKEMVRKYGSGDPRSVAANQNWKRSKQVMGALFQSRQSLKDTIYHGSLLVHNERTVLSVQKRRMDSDTRYRAMDDRAMTREENNVAEDQRAMTQNGPLPAPSSLPK